MPWCLMVWLGRTAARGKSMAASLRRCSPTLLGFSGTPPCFMSVRRCAERRQVSRELQPVNSTSWSLPHGRGDVLLAGLLRDFVVVARQAMRRGVRRPSWRRCS
ncbi:hypothetical protein ACQJBY_007323 [Aegilops geniculata]